MYKLRNIISTPINLRKHTSSKFQSLLMKIFRIKDYNHTSIKRYTNEVKDMIIITSPKNYSYTFEILIIANKNDQNLRLQSHIY